MLFRSEGEEDEEAESGEGTDAEEQEDDEEVDEKEPAEGDEPLIPVDELSDEEALDEDAMPRQKVEIDNKVCMIYACPVHLTSN